MFGCVLIFPFFIFHAKPGTTNNHRTRLSDISNLNPFTRDLNHITKLPKNFPIVEKTGLASLIFRLNSSE